MQNDPFARAAGAGFSVCCMPMVAAALQGRFGPTAPFLAASAFSLAHTAAVGGLLQETVAREARRRFSGLVNPLACLMLFTRARTLALACGMTVRRPSP